MRDDRRSGGRLRRARLLDGALARIPLVVRGPLRRMVWRSLGLRWPLPSGVHARRREAGLTEYALVRRSRAAAVYHVWRRRS